MSSKRSELGEIISNRIQKMLNELVPYPRRPFYFGDCIDDIESIIEDHTTKIEKSYGGCYNCYGKGYATATTWATAKGKKWPTNDGLVFCTCERGKQLESLWGQK